MTNSLKSIRDLLSKVHLFLKDREDLIKRSLARLLKYLDPTFFCRRNSFGFEKSIFSVTALSQQLDTFLRPEVRFAQLKFFTQVADFSPGYAVSCQGIKYHIQFIHTKHFHTRVWNFIPRYKTSHPGL
jgi:hypothetical protein